MSATRCQVVLAGGIGRLRAALINDDPIAVRGRNAAVDVAAPPEPPWTGRPAYLRDPTARNGPVAIADEMAVSVGSIGG
jgi:hypothetical protein